MRTEKVTRLGIGKDKFSFESKTAFRKKTGMPYCVFETIVCPPG